MTLQAKKADIAIQGGFLILGIFISLLTYNAWPLFFLFYFGVGTTQLVSFIVHLIINKENQLLTARKIYGVILMLVILAFIIVAPLGFIFNLKDRHIIDFLFFALFFTPLMAIFYFFISIIEIRKIK